MCMFGIVSDHVFSSGLEGGPYAEFLQPDHLRGSIILKNILCLEISGNSWTI